MAKEKTYTHAQVEELIAKAKTKIEQLTKDVSDRDAELSELKHIIADFKERESELQQQKNEQDKKSAELERQAAEFAPKMQELAKKQSELASAQAQFAEEKANLEAWEITLSAQEKAFDSIKEKLVKASEELAQKKAALFSDAEKLASELHEKRIAETEKEIQHMRDTAASEICSTRENAAKEIEVTRADMIAAANTQAEAIRAQAQKESERIVSDANVEAQKIIDKANSDTEELERQIAELTQRNAELSGENTKLSSKNAELLEDKRNLDSELKSQKAEFDETTAVYAKTMAAFETLKVQLEENAKSIADFTKEISGMDTREQELNAREDELNERDRKLLFNEKRNQNKTQELEEKENDIDGEVKARYPEIIADKDREIEQLKQETESLRNSLHSNKSITAKFDDLAAQFGGKNPAEVLLDYQRIQAELAIAMEKVNSTPSYALQKTAADLSEKETALNERENALIQKEKDSEQLRIDYAQQQAQNAELKQKYENLEKDKKIVEDQLSRLRSTYENPAERDERIKEINKPLIAQSLPRQDSSKLTEIGWLNGINEKIEKSGLHFSRRILNAFHTALKTSEMSPLTVLAGVSGTGKSELPRLYSRFGGINFLGVPVQPNWDCQEAMLGYYNSIDNCFEPTDMLRLLAQSQRKTDEQNGLDDVMTMILLDEMNLANVELYFADFLSKLETRRGLAENDPTFPKIGVKIGSKMADFPLKLGRNVLWTGTMNNDETTKTLSDKVIDRGIVINFPRPKKLIRTRTDSVLAEASDLLPKSVWNSWIEKAYKFSDEQINGYKDKIEKINEQLGKTGRALGHRVWQSIESYMSLYPTVIAAGSDDHERSQAMDDAFEDQLVQKVMPKLRGLETRGTQNDVLEAIKTIIPETLHEDFANAAEQNYGQFIWTTSGYLLRGEDSEEKKSDEAKETSTEIKEQNPSDENSIVAEAVAAIQNGTLKRGSREIKKFLEEKGCGTKECMNQIMEATKK
ncbi:MAG: hypothetical protein J5930_01485 [Treponema sp.]|nr:hypothetical protein [Treponema sp.]